MVREYLYETRFDTCYSRSFTSVKDFTAALEAFTQVIVTPGNALSHVVVCSIQKAKLISLIHNGTVFSLPSK